MRFLKRSLAVGSAVAMALTLTACGGAGGSSKESKALENKGEVKDKVELTMAGWNVKAAPEFQALADAFHEKNPNVTITVKDYPAKDYDTLLTTDLTSGKAPDLIPIKNMRRYIYYTSNNTMANVSSIGEEKAKDSNLDMSFFKADGKYYGVPFRQDNEVIYYNKDLFKKAGVPFPDGKWTWEDYIKTAKTLADKLGGDTKGNYTHVWPIFPGMAEAQTPGANVLSGDLSYMKKYYNYALELQKNGSSVTFGAAQTKGLTYQAQFNKQKTAMMPMGTWYIAMLLEAQKSGEADKFEWGIAPVPQYDSSTFDKPVTYGMSTPVAINAKLTDEAKLQAAGNFLRFVGSEEAGMALAKVGVFPAYLSEKVLDAYLDVPGMPKDDLTKMALKGQVRKPEFPISKNTMDILAVLKKTHSAIMTETTPVDKALADAEETLKSKGLVEKK